MPKINQKSDRTSINIGILGLGTVGVVRQAY